MNQPIGIFDSGIGGLTVFQLLRKRVPQEDLVYLGDTARVPYGTKSADTVARYAVQNARFLAQRRIKLLIVACNTASAFSLEPLQESLQIPVVGVIEPGIRAALNRTRTRRLGVIGTEGTIESGVYSRGILAREPAAVVREVACPLFVPLVEEGLTAGPIADEAARRYLAPLASDGMDTLILGCTHYPLLKETISQVTGAAVTLIDSAAETADEVARLLQERGLSRSSGERGQDHFYTTDHPRRFQEVGRMFLGRPLDRVEQVDI